MKRGTILFRNTDIYLFTRQRYDRDGITYPSKGKLYTVSVEREGAVRLVECNNTSLAGIEPWFDSQLFDLVALPPSEEAYLLRWEEQEASK